MILTWWSVLIILFSVLSIGMIVYGCAKYDGDTWAGVGVIMALLLALICWVIMFNETPAIKMTEESKYIHRFTTEKNTILEFPDGKVRTFDEMKYMNATIRVIKETCISTYNDTTVRYKVAK